MSARLRVTVHLRNGHRHSFPADEARVARMDLLLREQTTPYLLIPEPGQTVYVRHTEIVSIVIDALPAVPH